MKLYVSNIREYGKAIRTIVIGLHGSKEVGKSTYLSNFNFRKREKTSKGTHLSGIV